MTMTGTTLSIRFVFILATVIGIHGNATPREATLSITNNFEDGLSSGEFKVDYPGIIGSESPIIKIFKKGDPSPKFTYTVEVDAEKAQMFYFRLKKTVAPAGSYEVQVCLTPEQCSEKRAAFGKILDEGEKPALSCAKKNGMEEDPFNRFVDETVDKRITIEINGGQGFLTPEQCKGLPVEKTAFSKLNIESNPAYTTLNGKPVFYAAVWYDGRHLAELFETIKSNGYCSRKYIFWATASVVDPQTKLVKRRYRGTIIVTEAQAENFILNQSATPFPVEFVRQDDKALLSGTYDVAVSFCATDKDRINSSICSEAVYSETKLTF